jgi:hypothetical protein
MVNGITCLSGFGGICGIIAKLSENWWGHDSLIHLSKKETGGGDGTGCGNERGRGGRRGAQRGATEEMP